MVATLLLVVLLGVATATDVLWHRVYNWTTYPGILAAWGLNGLGTLLLQAAWVDRGLLERLGWIGLLSSLLGFLACGSVMLVCFVLFNKVGGGDVKLIAMLGALLGPEKGIEAMLWTFVLGGCVGLIVLVWRVGPLRLTARVLRHLLWSVRLGWVSPPTEEERAQLRLPLSLAPNALAAALIVQFSLVRAL